VPTKQQVARIGVDDATWRSFRQAALDRELSVSGYLGRLVHAELRRRGATTAGQAPAGASEAELALAALVDTRAAIDDLDDIAGRLARSATAHGGSWRDVASSLRLTEHVARETYTSRQARP
jgi:hypothetical protein